ncbi:EAL domain-containing protein [Methylosinus sp. Sm6]|uniref:sensor domain-containing protein n=1 Tax=Methylosinus sp. Sm6 TaxID=2866948 RepID=UPI001C993C40|nr:EAL domain-containing protein [Methylosinus sp. Sm6]MBY6241411.1 EAL domain-containing protein [Methylosinus sp. Sm6]
MAEPKDDEIAHLRTEIEALRLANGALERQLSKEAEQAETMLRGLEAQASALRDANLRQSSQRDFTQRVMDTAGALVVVLRPDGRIRQVNRRFIEEMSDPAAAPEGRVLDDWLHPDERSDLGKSLLRLPWPVLSPLIETLRRSGAYAAEHRLREREGHYRNYWLEASLQYDPQGKEEGAVVWAADITALKQQQERLRRSESLLKEAQHIAQLGHWELDLTRDRLNWSEEVFRIFELEPVSGPFGYADFIALVHPDDRAAVDEAYMSSLSARRAYAIDHRLLFADGRVKWVAERCVTHYDSGGRPLRSVGTVQDITANRAAEEQLRLAANVFDDSLNGIVVTDADARIVKVNPAFSKIMGYSAAEIVGRKTSLLKSGRHDQEFYRTLWATLREEGQWQGEIWDRSKDGRSIPLWQSISAVRDAQGRIANFVGVFFDLSEHKRSADHIRHLAYYDTLTELPNRQLFGERCERALQRARRGGHSLALLFLDLDRFKYVNDSLGHPVGDALLREVAQRLKDCLRRCDTVARLGGDEFIVLLENVRSRRAIEATARRILAAFHKPFMVHGHRLDVRTSIGVSCYPGDGDDATTLIKNADLAMYRAKESGRDDFRFYEAHLTTHAGERLFLESELRNALKRNELAVHYQPQFAFYDGRLVGAEALLRWRHPQRGWISPDLFIPIAEDAGLMVSIGEWVLRAACHQAKAWMKAGLKSPRMAVNVSGVQVERSDILATVTRALAEAALPAEYLELEITESFIMRQTQRNIKVMEDLRALGVSLAIDDFGAGQSSLRYLNRLPVDKLKIDRSFIRDIPGDSDEMTITRAILALGRSLRLQVLAEGVETALQAEFLKEAGCDEVQGHYFGRPMEATNFRDLLLDRTFSAPCSLGAAASA